MIRRMYMDALVRCDRVAQALEAKVVRLGTRASIQNSPGARLEHSRRFALLLWLVGFATPAVQGASFDCRKASTAVEKVICADEEISKLDDELGRAYRTAVNIGEHAELRRTQTEWLKNRDDVCGDSGPGAQPDRRCLKTAYEFRIWKLAPERDDHNLLSAGRYRVGWGWDRPLCRKLSAHLNAHPEWPPLSCGMKVGNSNPDFALPAWETLDTRTHREILKAIWDEAVGPRPSLSRTETDRIFEERFNAGDFKLAKAIFDVNNSGSPLTVYRAELDPCRPDDELGFNIPLVPRLYAVGPDGKRPHSNSFIALTSPPRDVFLHEGQAYLTWWFGRFSQGTASLGIYRNSAPGAADVFAAEPVCTLSYRK